MVVIVLSDKLFFDGEKMLNTFYNLTLGVSLKANFPVMLLAGLKHRLCLVNVQHNAALSDMGNFKIDLKVGGRIRQANYHVVGNGCELP